MVYIDNSVEYYINYLVSSAISNVFRAGNKQRLVLNCFDNVHFCTKWLGIPLWSQLETHYSESITLIWNSSYISIKLVIVPLCIHIFYMIYKNLRVTHFVCTCNIQGVYKVVLYKLRETGLWVKIKRKPPVKCF